MHTQLLRVYVDNQHMCSLRISANITSAALIPHEAVPALLKKSRQRYVENGEIARHGQKSEFPFHDLPARIAQAGVTAPKWVTQLIGEGHGDAPVISHTLDVTAMNELQRNRGARARLEIAVEIANYTGRLLKIGGALCAVSSPGGASIEISVLPDVVLARLVIAGSQLVDGAHELHTIPTDRPVSLADLRAMVAANEWPICIPGANPQANTPKPVIHGAKDLDDELVTGHDYYHALRQMRWPVDNRRELITFHDLIDEAGLSQAPFAKRLKLSILSGPDPFHYGKYGFYGALFFMMANDGLKGHFGTEKMNDQLLLLHRKIRKQFADHPKQEEIMDHWARIITVSQMTAKEKRFSAGDALNDEE